MVVEQLSLGKRVLATKDELSRAFSRTASHDELETLRVQYLGRNGIVAHFMAELKELSLEEKKEVGPLLNDLKTYAHEAHQRRLQELENERKSDAVARERNFDVTAYRLRPIHGSLHLYTQIITQLENIFTSMGYELADGPELETEYYNCDALNIPAGHPARDMQDTIWMSDAPGMLLRSHTSPIQVRAMEQRGAPLAIFAHGRTYRHEATDATHDYMFSQVEGLLVDKNVSVAQLLATIKSFLSAVFEREDLDIRARPGFFPFVEPGLEIECSCPFCTAGCSVCKKSRWIELMGAGLVHPHVLKCGGVDPDVYSGFAFGMGLERLAMIKYGINDIRLFHGSRLSFLEQF